MCVTGTTEHLRQMAADMQEAGPGATDSQTYREIVAELELRDNENAPGAAATASEGKETTPHQEGEFRA